PAVSLSKSGTNDTLKERGETAVGSARDALRSAIVIAEIATSLVLLVGAGLLTKSFIRVVQADRGFNASHVLTMEIALPEAQYRGQKQTVFFSQVLDHVASLPGVQSAAVATNLPIQGNGWTSSFSIHGEQPRVPPHAYVATISPKYFETLQIPMIEGRP